MTDGHSHTEEQREKMRYESPEIVDLGSIAAHTFMPISVGRSQSHKGFNHPNGDFDCELSSSPDSAPGTGPIDMCGDEDGPPPG